MGAELEKLRAITGSGEGAGLEFKEFLTRETHLKAERRQTLACQMKYNLLQANGRAQYIIGITDSGYLKGISKQQLNESVSVLHTIADDIGAHVNSKEECFVNGRYVGIIGVRDTLLEKDHILVGTAGHVDHGKSTLVGTIVSGVADDGSGKTRLYLDVKPHEIERGLSADISYVVYGFNEDIIRLKNPLSKKERARVVQKSEKLVSFVDTVGHEPWLRTTIRGIVGPKLDYGLLVIAADDGVTHVTKEHLGILLAMELPTIVAVTKIDKVTESRVREVESQVREILGIVGRVPYRLKEAASIEKVYDKIGQGTVVPIVRTSPVTMAGIDIFDELFKRLPKRNISRNEDFEIYIDRVYQISGVGSVASGTVKSGVVSVGDLLCLGPAKNGTFRQVKVQSIEMHHCSVDKASAGDIVGIAIRGVKPHEIERGMVLATNAPDAIREFLSEVYVLHHPTRIGHGYEPVIHIETISESVTFDPEREFMMAGEYGKVTVRFKYRPYHVYAGQKFIFREGKSKGVGKILSVLN
ncbi:MAG: GTP-binding protein [Euryarchaeota archaeon]|nr:GTP-binding protein [Euryarchaeota archaeon]